MCTDKKASLISILILTAILCLTNNVLAAAPAELTSLQESFSAEIQGVSSESQRKDVINNYIQRLTALADDLRFYKNDRDGTNAVRKEIRKARKDLNSEPSTRSAPTPEPVPVKDPPRPLITKAAAEPVPEPEQAETSPPPEPAKEQSAMVEELIVKKQTTRPSQPEPAPAPIMEKAVPAPVITRSTPKPASAAPVPAPVVKPVIKPITTITEPKPVAKKPAATPATTIAEPKPVARKPVAKPVAIAEPKPVVTAPAAKPAAKPEIKKPVPAAVANKPATKPEIKKVHVPKVYISSVEGLAGKGELSKNNIYTFDLPEIGSSTQMAFWATGKNSIDSYGKVTLVTPEGKRHFVRIWKESNFKQPSTEISSFYMLKPFSDDITKKVSGPGTYKIEFEWTGGKDPLIIFRVEITS